MTIVLISGGGAEQCACRLLADQLKQLGQPCLTIGAPIPSEWHSPWPAARPHLEIPADAVLGTSLLDDATAIGLFLQDTSQLNRLVHSYREHCRNRGRTPVPVFSGPLAPVVGDNLISDLANRHRCDLVLLHGERQLQEAAAMRFNWPADLPAPTLVSGGFWFMPERPALGCLNGGLTSPPYSLLVLAQQEIPVQAGAKSQLLRWLIRLAEASPQWNVVIQRDHAWSDDAAWIADETHGGPNSAHESGVRRTRAAVHPALQLHRLRQRQFPMAGHSHGLGRQMVIGDFGIHSGQGTSGFFGSGAMHRLRSITHLDQLLELPRHSHRWLESMGWDVHDGGKRLLQALEELSR